jgi:hypothetical protein
MDDGIRYFPPSNVNIFLQDGMILGFQTGLKENRSSRNLRCISTRNSQPIK